jgi:hypothetical protein
LFTVADRRGRFITDLTKDDFEVIESKKSQNLLECGNGLAVAPGILIDTSNSVRDRFKFEQEVYLLC